MGPDVLIEKFGLSDKSFVITGASSGIGRAMASHLALAGASVVLVARRRTELQQVAEQISQLGGKAAIIVADLSERENLSEIATQCKVAASASGIDGVVNAAGINLREGVEDITLESWDLTLNLNLSVPFFFTREFIPQMRERNYGRVINIASLQSTRAFPNLTWFGILVAVNLQTAWLSPPVALSAYFLKGVVPEWDLKDIYGGMMQFMGIQLFGLILIITFPQIVLWLPEYLYPTP